MIFGRERIQALESLYFLGVGFRPLMEYILKAAKEDGCARATLHVQLGNQPLSLATSSVNFDYPAIRHRMIWPFNFMKKLDLAWPEQSLDTTKISNRPMPMFLRRNSNCLNVLTCRRSCAPNTIKFVCELKFRIIVEGCHLFLISDKIQFIGTLGLRQHYLWVSVAGSVASAWAMAFVRQKSNKKAQKM